MKGDNGGGQSGQQVVLRDRQSARPRLACWELEGAGKGGAAGSRPRGTGPQVGERKRKKRNQTGEKGRRKRKKPAGVGEWGDLGGGMFQLLQAAGEDLGCRA